VFAVTNVFYEIVEDEVASASGGFMSVRVHEVVFECRREAMRLRETRSAHCKGMNARRKLPPCKRVKNRPFRDV